MPAFLAPLAAKIMLGVILALIAGGGLGYFIHYQRAVGAEKQIAKEQARAKEVEDAWIQRYSGRFERVDTLTKKAQNDAEWRNVTTAVDPC
jgi:hypothetical protein